MDEKTIDVRSPRRPNRRLQFGLSALFAVTFLFAVLSGWLKVFGAEGIRVPLAIGAAVLFGIIAVGGPLLVLSIVCLGPKSSRRRIVLVAVALLTIYLVAGVVLALAIDPPRDNHPWGIQLDEAVGTLCATFAWWVVQGGFALLIYGYWAWRKSNEPLASQRLPQELPFLSEDDRGEN